MDSSPEPYAYIVGTFLWSALAGLLFYNVFKKLMLFQRMPPGPYGLPIIGSLLNLIKNDAIEELIKYKEKYGNVFSMSVGNFYVIVINGYKAIQEVAKRDEFSGRPDFELWHIRNYEIKNRGILFCDGGSVWQEQRRFALRTLRNFGLGKESMEGMIIHEMQALVKMLTKSVGNSISLNGAFNAAVLNSLWYILTGKRYELDDPKFQEAINLLIESIQNSPLANPGLFFPWPTKHNLIRRGAWAQAALMRAKIRELINGPVEEHFETYNDSVTRDFLDSYIHEMKKSDENSSFHSEEGKLNLKVLLLDLFVAGAETTSTTLSWSVLFLTQNLEVQKKIQSEIDLVIGDRPASRDDKPKLLYVEAFLNEVHRCASLLPVDVFHKMQEDTEYDGHLLPKGSIVFLNLYDAHHDQSYWKDPDVFRPERFLDESGTKLIKHDALMPFGTGKRQCLGELLARDTLFIFLTGLLQNFSFKIDPEMKNVDVKGTPTFIMSPKPFKTVISNRK